VRGQGTYVQASDVSWASLKQLLPYLWRYRTRLLVSLLLLVAAKFASVGLPYLLKLSVDRLDLGRSNPIYTVPLLLLIAYAVARFANVLFSELRDTVFGRVTENAMHDIGLKVFRHLHSLDLQFHLDRKTGALARDIDRGTNGISFLLRFMVFNILPTLLEIFLVIGILSMHYSLWFGLIVFVAILFYIVFSVFATERRTVHVREMNSADSDSSSRAIDSLLNYETVKYFNNEDYEADLYDQSLARWQRARRVNRISMFALNSGQAFIISLAMGAAMILAAYHVSENKMTLGDFALVNAYMMQIFMPLNFLGFVYREMKGSMVNIENMFKLLREQPEISDADAAQTLHPGNATIRFDRVSFYYHAERPILRNVSFTVEPRQRVALVGSSGSGKSTTARLLFRFYDVKEGAIYIGDQDIRSLTLNSLRATMAFVPQDTVLFNASIVDNIRYGDIRASDERVQKAIDMAHLREFIHSLPQGENTLVGERGLKVSGGEKQRIAIARALLKNPSILVFDEATSSLDSAAEKEIMRAINEISGERTVLIIAHRLSTIANVDQILVLDKGEIVERGTHSQLLKEDGRYARLWNLQMSEKSSGSTSSDSA